MQSKTINNSPWCNTMPPASLLSACTSNFTSSPYDLSEISTVFIRKRFLFPIVSLLITISALFGVDWRFYKISIRFLCSSLQVQKPNELFISKCFFIYQSSMYLANFPFCLPIKIAIIVFTLYRPSVKFNEQKDFQ